VPIATLLFGRRRGPAGAGDLEAGLQQRTPTRQFSSALTGFLPGELEPTTGPGRTAKLTGRMVLRRGQEPELQHLPLG
jgi:hypothetical protein